MAELSLARLTEERKTWRKDHPVGFFARPENNPDGSANLYKWLCGIPGKEGTPWEGGVYPLSIQFSSEYPSKPPRCSLPPNFFHPNVFPNGDICLSIINESGWKPSISVKQIVLGVQELLDTPNTKSPASNAYKIYEKDRVDYNKKVKEQAKRYPPQL
ncbi:putative ubiquitin-conjugating enzyme E2 [Heterostelium album PN500]|uniref:Putative ubiquitin-conjugating enzyme E2 n=1 Tax=Heterostelium pallidum (strain ATCC 26659 / Pp 5 / PN500) TaxID=670386 RepID=D3AXD1_HETP5|nr:putative ubiquitin-conjugating enzyme E2 [Heterostelium album PN500]EFA86200.1 putative ubiquitin-conjugating enzyme E2 [Heterostelium album PN500]|eukprot:XP_020438305.1 putative ubiquitin-conjugating enzyme E2 [Heterostelium album PN500]